VDLGIVKKSGAWYTYEGEQLGQGRENAKKFLLDNPEVMVEITDRVWREVQPEVDEVDEVQPEVQPEVGEVRSEVDAQASGPGSEEFSEADDLPISLEGLPVSLDD
jgi:hypothetical protein